MSSVSTKPASNQQHSNKENPVASLIKELIDINTEIFELKETIVAKGVPYNTLNSLVEMSAVGKSDELVQMKKSALQTAESQYGAGAIKSDEFQSSLTKLIEYEEDLSHLRKIARGRNMDPQATNLLTNVIRQNPGDKGEKVLNTIVEYALACDINVTGVSKTVPVVEETPESVLPDIEIPLPPKHGWHRFKHLIFDIAVGTALAFTALALLT